MSAKHFFHDPTHLVNNALHSLTLTNPSIALNAQKKIIFRRNRNADQVSVISGGGSGHEPSFCGFVGDGLLSAAVAGTIFASPSTDQIYTALRNCVNSERGVLVMIMNYTGDVLNFGIAVEKAKAAGLKVEMLVVQDDVGVGRAKSGKVGRRGISGFVFVCKIAGALAARGASLEEVHKVARLVAQNTVSVGASLSRVHVPGHEPPDAKSSEVLSTEEIEIGMGIHNEPGSGREVIELQDLVKKLLAQLLDQGDKDRAFLQVNSNEVALLINNLGGLSNLEIGGITTEVMQQLQITYNIRPVRILTGAYMTSLNGMGFSISILNVVNTDIGGPNMIQLLDAPAEATGWSAPIKKETWEQQHADNFEDVLKEEDDKPSGLLLDGKKVQAALTAGLKRLIIAENEVTAYDTVVGDGDCGVGLRRGAETILTQVSEKSSQNDAVLLVSAICHAVERSMDGTSGALYTIFLNALLTSLKTFPPGSCGVITWIAALRSAYSALARYTPAAPGDRTLMDALEPFIATLEKTKDLKTAAQAAREGAESTKGMEASLGRTVYVGGDGFKRVPDPGAWGLSEFLLGLAGMETKPDAKTDARTATVAATKAENKAENEGKTKAQSQTETESEAEYEMI